MLLLQGAYLFVRPVHTCDSLDDLRACLDKASRVQASEVNSLFFLAIVSDERMSETCLQTHSATAVL